MTARQLNKYASQRMLNCRKGSKKWMYYRGICIAIEALFKKGSVSMEWIDKVGDQ